MIFLIEYDRNKGKIVTIQSYQNWERSNAESLRLSVELSLRSRGVEHEVVLLEAADENACARLIAATLKTPLKLPNLWEMGLR